MLVLIFWFIQEYSQCPVCHLYIYGDLLFVFICFKVNGPELNWHYEVLGTAAAFTATCTR